MSKFPFFKKNKYLSRDIEPHEVFIDNLAQKKEEDIGISRKRLEVHLSAGVLYAFFLFVFLLLFVLLGRSFYLQIIEGDHYTARANRNFLSISNIQTSRGIIYDSDHNQLVYNNPRQDLLFQKTKVSGDEEEAAQKVAKIIEKDESEIIKKISESEGSSVVIERGLNHEELVKIEAISEELSGFYVKSTVGRKYLNGEAFAHVLGYIGKIDLEHFKENSEKYTINDYVGKSGVEKFYEDRLTRVGDEVVVERDVSGEVKQEKVIDSDVVGENVVLTIDSDLQEISYEKTKEKLEEMGLDSAAVVAMDPDTGEVLTMVSLPTFDNNTFNQGMSTEESRELFENKNGIFLNRAISVAYPTGSVIKPLLAVAALEEGIISPEKEIYSPGYISIPNPWNPSKVTIFKDFRAHGWRDMREAIAVSSNVYFYSIGGGYEDQEGLGVSRINKYLSLFGWGEKTNIDLFGEKNSSLPNPEWKKEKLNDIWRLGDTYNLSIGQGYLSITPLQITSSFVSIVNGGTLLQPYIVKEIIDDNGSLIEEKKPTTVRKNIAKPENLEIVKQGMKKTVEIGTAKALQDIGVTVGAKTGTAQTSKKGVNHSLISLFAPYDDPEIVMTIIVEDIDGVSPVAVHLARDILTEYYQKDKDKLETEE